MRKMISTFLTLVSLVVGIKTCGDFYWRHYDGVIPTDAIPAGKYMNGSSYIGQAYIHTFGVLLGTIIPGKTVIDVPCYGVKKGVIIKILCAPDKSKYYWLPTTSLTYLEDTADKCPILGGYDQKHTLGTLHIGRTSKHDNVIIGNIAAYSVSNPTFFYPLNNAEIGTSEYDVLIYKDYSRFPSQQNNVCTAPNLR